MEFKPVTIEDKQIFDKYLKKYQTKVSEITFTNIFCWRHFRKYEFCIFEDHLIIKYQDNGEELFYQPIGEKPEEIIKKIIKPKMTFVRVEKHIADKLKHLKIEHDRNNDDYVYKIEDLSSLEGGKYEAKRNFIKQMLKNNPSSCVLKKETALHFLDLQQRWCDIRNCHSDPSMHAEDFAIREAIENLDKLNIFGICIHVNGKIEGFAIAEELNDNTIVEHHEKGNTEFKGIYQYILHELAKSIEKKYIYLNREQDLGVEGLRKSKESYHPVEMVEKYSINI